MPRYAVTEDDLPYAAEFLESPLGYHSPGLQRVLNRMRAQGTHEPKYVLVVAQRHAKWLLGRLPAKRGMPVDLIDDVVYTDLLEAERDVFRRRWRDLTGKDLQSQLTSTGKS